MSYKILVVDDNEMNRTLVAKILELEGYTVRTAGSGADALLAVTDFMPDLAVMDVMMEDMDGYTLCRKLRQPPYSVEFPVFMLTAMNSEYEKAQALAAGADDIWSKPFSLDLFCRRVEEFLEAGKPAGPGAARSGQS